ncbi:hypothetical protein HDK90DRAFT_538304 [Phyllosticta capitalensis]|uniref:Uncharacterized protein n=1 Tax=Phyllosticta capitalensis TaxID=121624 RepID=A0ABR1Z210_9PEZI
MESSSTAASWLSYAVTAVGLGSLTSQASVINDKMDPFHETRTVQHLGIWFTRQPQFPFWKVAKPPPTGPEINAKLSDGFCGLNNVYLSRVPVAQPAGDAGWATFLAVIHQEPLGVNSPSNSNAELEKGLLPRDIERELTSRGWESLPTAPLVRHRKSACTTISRTTLLTLLSLTNARPVFRHSDAAGHRAAYASYTGQWYIDWPLGSPATVHFAAHDSHSAATDVYPPSFERRVDKCVQMMAGSRSRGAKPGRYVLKHIPKGFPGAHGSRHLYNMMGGKVYEIDFLLAQRLGDHDAEPLGAIKLNLPSTLDGVAVEMFVPAHEKAILTQAMDCLPWSPLSWSIHRGLRDILMAFSRIRMDGLRQQLASTLRHAVLDDPFALDAMGWEPTFVRQHMGEMAAGAVVAGSGNSGDLVRVVTDVALSLCASSSPNDFDETTFWRSSAEESQGLDQQAIIALTKCFTVEWSIDFDYQMYHDLPLKLYFAEPSQVSEQEEALFIACSLNVDLD